MTQDALDKWHWSHDEIKRVGHHVVDLIADYLAELPQRPVFRPFPSELAGQHMKSAAPEPGRSAEEILATCAREIEPYPFWNGHPQFYGWVNSPPAVMGIFAEALASVMNPSCAGGNHAAIFVERAVVNWFRQILGFREGSMGLLVSGSSMAALTAPATARHVRCGFDVRTKGLRGAATRLTFYRSVEGHGCHPKAIELLGIGSENLRTVPHDRALPMLPAALEALIREDVQTGCTPVAVVASAGTVNTGAIDPLSEIAAVCRRHKVWLHVDAAYGGPAILTREYASSLAAIACADSVALDPHKWLCIPVEAGLVLARRGEEMRAAFSLVPPYLQTDARPGGVAGPPWFSEYGFQQTRSFRALKVWMAMQFHGLAGYRALVEQNIDFARRLASALRSNPRFDVFEPQSLSIVCFRYLPLGWDQSLPKANELNQAILEKLQLGGEVFLSGTVIAGRFWLRACVVNPGARIVNIPSIERAVAAAATALGG